MSKQTKEDNRQMDHKEAQKQEGQAQLHAHIPERAAEPAQSAIAEEQIEAEERELLITGQLYRAVSPTVLVEIEPTNPVEGMKILLLPDQVVRLKSLQKKLRKLLGSKPTLPVTLNALVATFDLDSHIEISAQWIRESIECSDLRDNRTKTQQSNNGEREWPVPGKAQDLA